ncbi:LIM domain protein [Ancylostoma caninum]|uniref:LIM domain protein n=1 Tax=Ancylostoma caninum TaxID=29170 RepID=A0A368GVV3_ANCCA|nr:LIM domain protein [Ancylostoma caninum]
MLFHGRKLSTKLGRVPYRNCLSGRVVHKSESVHSLTFVWLVGSRALGKHRRTRYPTDDRGATNRPLIDGQKGEELAARGGNSGRKLSRAGNLLRPLIGRDLSIMTALGPSQNPAMCEIPVRLIAPQWREVQEDLSYKDKHWHEHCFLCNMCKISLVDMPFGSKNDRIFCSNCYDQAFATRCDGCNEIFRAGLDEIYAKTPLKFK